MSDLYKKEKIEDAISFLKDNGYIVKKPSEIQLEDAKKCEDCGFDGECAFCSCSVCIIQ